MNIYKKTSPTSNFEVIELSDKVLGKGGQGSVYKITTQGYENYCVKIYKSADSASKSFDRITYMIQNPPDNIMGNSAFRICWPVAFAYDSDKKFIGYIMPLAFPNSRDLKILEIYNPKPIAQQSRYKKYPEWHNKYELNDTVGIQNRMKMLCNWAIAIHCIHETQKYVIIDLKPENVMATATGKISIIDTDSFQISENNRILFSGPAYTAAYFPPEGKLHKQQNAAFPRTCDYFAAAVVFYKILTGVHPYGGTNLLPPYDTLETEEECIREGLFAYGNKKQYIKFPTGLNLQNNFKNLPLLVQQLFIRAFDSDINQRPTMEEWGRLFKEVIASNKFIGQPKSPIPPKTISKPTTIAAHTSSHVQTVPIQPPKKKNKKNIFIGIALSIVLAFFLFINKATEKPESNSSPQADVLQKEYIKEEQTTEISSTPTSSNTTSAKPMSDKELVEAGTKAYRSLNYDKALEYFEKAANNGQMLAQYNLAKMYLNGNGTSKNPQIAAQWFMKAAQQGDAAAQYMIGKMYLDGQGVNKDEQQALTWLKKAATQGNKEAIKILKRY